MTGESFTMPTEAATAFSESTPIRIEDIPKNATGHCLNPHNWDFDFEMDFKAALTIFRKKHPGPQGRESERHYLLKLASMVYVSQVHGDTTFIREVTDDKYRSDVYCRLPEGITIRVECGDLTYRDKIEYLLNTIETDVVIWVPYPEKSQMHYFADVEFLYRCVHQKTNPEPEFPYSFGSGSIICAHLNEQKYYATYAALWPDDDAGIIPFYTFYRKSLIPQGTPSLEVKAS